MEDIPFHLKRIYLNGENNYKFPWQIQLDIEIENVNENILTTLISDFNKNA